uniref:Uncharacterized protein n=1 Tax=Oryzias sinensis TaxID=183150 RepID=A0A8C8DBQ3_9TELE
QLLLPPLKENDTHCLSFFFYQAGGREGIPPATLNVYVKENNNALGVPVFNSSGPAYHIWKEVELAVSIFWPNQYQLVLEAISTGQKGLLAIKDISLQGHQCSKTPHFLHIKGVEVNAGQTASFQCTVNGRPQSSVLLYLQGMGSRQAVVKETKPVNSRRYVASFDVENTTKGDSGRYRCIALSERGVGVSSYAELTVKRRYSSLFWLEVLTVAAFTWTKTIGMIRIKKGFILIRIKFPSDGDRWVMLIVDPIVVLMNTLFRSWITTALV